ncbi:MAG: hypothetical protein KZQ90_06020 [Candidatus Thiodiazotropha sp. (ex Codakia rugifera)]|nr:hypothetical protein [Candidatus Thiodiazotropha sp. (ex Codakia rugifera)]
MYEWQTLYLGYASRSQVMDIRFDLNMMSCGDFISADAACVFNMMDLVQQLIVGTAVDQQQAEDVAGLLIGQSLQGD